MPISFGRESTSENKGSEFIGTGKFRHLFAYVTASNRICLVLKGRRERGSLRAPRNQLVNIEEKVEK